MVVPHSLCSVCYFQNSFSALKGPGRRGMDGMQVLIKSWYQRCNKKSQYITYLDDNAPRRDFNGRFFATTNVIFFKNWALHCLCNDFLDQNVYTFHTWLRKEPNSLLESFQRHHQGKFMSRVPFGCTELNLILSVTLAAVIDNFIPAMVIYGQLWVT